MSYRKSLIAIAAFSMMAIGAKSTDASYAYSVAVTPGVINSVSGLSQISFLGHTDTATATTTVVATDVGLISQAPDASPDPISGTFTVTFTITNNGATGTLSFLESIAGTASVNNSNLDTTLISYGSQPVNIGGTLFSLFAGSPGSVDTFFSAPTVNGNTGSISTKIILGASVPEPASMAMVAMGLGGTFVVRRIRRRTV